MSLEIVDHYLGSGQQTEQAHRPANHGEGLDFDIPFNNFVPDLYP